MNETPGDVPPPTSAPHGAPSGEQTPDSGGFFGGLRRLDIQRDDNRWVGGVAAGLARKLQIDPIIVRGLILVTVLLGGLGMVAYAAAWLLLPERSDGRIHAEELIKGRFDIAMVGAAFLVIAGLARGNSLPLWWGNSHWSQDLVGTVVTIGIIVAVISIYRQRRTPPAPYTPGYPAPPVPAQPFPAAAPEPAAAAAAATPPSAFRVISTNDQEISMSTTPPAPAGPGYAPPPQSPPAGGAGQPPYGHGYYPAPPVPPTPPVPPVPPSLPRQHRAPGPGRGVAAGVIGLTLIAMAFMMIVERITDFEVPVDVLTVGIGIVLTGAAIVVAGLRGRRSGGLMGLAIVGIIIGLPIAAADSTDGHWVWSGNFGDDGAVETPLTRSAAAEGINTGIGDVTVDLTEVPLNDSLLTVPIKVGAGDVVIYVPEDIAVTADATIGIGEVKWRIDGDRSAGGIGIDSRSFSSDETKFTEPVLSLDISVGTGSVTVKEK